MFVIFMLKACQYSEKCNIDINDVIEARTRQKNNDYNAVPIDKDNGFAVMKTSDYQSKLNDVVGNSRQFKTKP